MWDVSWTKQEPRPRGSHALEGAGRGQDRHTTDKNKLVVEHVTCGDQAWNDQVGPGGYGEQQSQEGGDSWLRAFMRSSHRAEGGSGAAPQDSELEKWGPEVIG